MSMSINLTPGTGDEGEDLTGTEANKEEGTTADKVDDPGKVLGKPEEMEIPSSRTPTPGGNFQYAVVDCRSIRVGSCKVTDNGATPLKVTFTGRGIMLNFPLANSRFARKTIPIPKEGIFSIQACFEWELPLLSLQTGPEFATWLRTALEMDGSPEDKHSDYCCPVKGHSCQRDISLVAARTLSDAGVGIIRTLYKDELQEITLIKLLMLMNPAHANKYRSRVNSKPGQDSPMASTSGMAGPSPASGTATASATSDDISPKEINSQSLAGGFQYAVTDCRAIRVGGYQVTFTGTGATLKVSFTAIGILFTLSMTNANSKRVMKAVWIPNESIHRIYAYLSEGLPVIITLLTEPKYAVRLGEVLGEGIGDKRAIAFLLAGSTFPVAAVGRMRTLYGDKLQERDYEKESPILLYEGSKARIPISPKDIACLGHSKYVTDAVIDFWLSVIHNEILSEVDRKRTFVFSSSFYDELTTRKTFGEDVNLTAAERRHARVMARTENVDIFEKDFLLVPVKEGEHWFIAIICFPGMTGYHDYDTLEALPEYVAGLKRKREGDKQRVKQPCILLLDSLAGDIRARIYSTLREYLTIEYKTKKNGERLFEFKTMPGCMPKVPQQPNFYDGGIFMLEYVERFFSHPVSSYDTKVINLMGWFESEIVENKRREIYDFIKKKVEGQCSQNLSRVPEVNFEADENSEEDTSSGSSDDDDDESDDSCDEIKDDSFLTSLLDPEISDATILEMYDNGGEMTLYRLSLSLAEANKSIVEKHEEVERLQKRVKQLTDSKSQLKPRTNKLPGTADDGRKIPELIFPEEVWAIILGNLTDSKDMQSASKTCQLFEKLMARSRTTWMFEKVFPYLYQVLEKAEILSCRLVSKNWTIGVDQFFENHPTQRPHDESSADPKYPAFVIPKLCDYTFSNDGPSLRTNNFHFEMKDHPRNPFIGRSVSLTEVEFPRDDVVRDDEFWNAVYSFLKVFGKHIWYFNFSTMSLSEVRPHNNLTPFLTHDLFTLLPNLRKLRIGGYMMPSIVGVDRMPPAPHLETLQLDDCTYWSFPHPVFNLLINNCHAQLKRLHLKCDLWRKVSHLDWTGLVELHIEDLETDPDLRSLLQLNVPRLQKLGLSIRDNGATTTHHELQIILRVVDRLCSTSKLSVLRLHGGFPARAIRCLPCELVAPPSLKTLEVENVASPGPRISYDFLLRFPFIQNLNVFWRAEKDVQFRRWGNEIQFRDEVDYYREFEEEAKVEIEFAIVNMHEHMYAGSMYYDIPGIWKLLPRLDVFTFQNTLYTREGYDRYYAFRLNKYLEEKEKSAIDESLKLQTK